MKSSLLKKLASKIAKQEGKKHQATIGDIREIIGLISDEIYSDHMNVSLAHPNKSLYVHMLQSGERRNSRRLRGKK